MIACLRGLFLTSIAMRRFPKFILPSDAVTLMTRIVMTMSSMEVIVMMMRRKKNVILKKMMIVTIFALASRLRRWSQIF